MKIRRSKATWTFALIVLTGLRVFLDVVWTELRSVPGAVATGVPTHWTFEFGKPRTRSLPLPVLTSLLDQSATPKSPHSLRPDDTIPWQ